MKKQSLLSALFCLLNLVAFSQAPLAFKYAAVALDASGNPMSINTVKFTILEDSDNGPVRYQETHSNITAVNGKFNLNVGQGTPTIPSLTFAGLDWANHMYWLQVAINNQTFGVSQLMSVPYALYAAQSGTNSDTYTPGQGISITPGNEIINTAPDQPVSLTGSGNTTVSGAYPNFTISSASTAYTPGQGIEITAGNAINNLGDLSDTNEIQQLSIANGAISLSKNGGSVNLPTAGPGISIVNNVITNAQPDQPITLNGGGNTTVTGTYPDFTITSTDGGGVAPGTGIEMDVNGSTTVVSARNTDSIWNASALRGRPIGGMEPTSADAGRMLVYDHNTEVWKADTLKGDFVTKNDGSIQVAALRGRPIGGMEPTTGSSMLIFNSSDDEYDFMNPGSDITGDTDGVFTLNKIQGRVVDLAGMGQDMVLTCVPDGNGGLEFRCLPPAGGTGFTVPYSYTENVLNTTLFSMTANTANTNYVMQITNNGTGNNQHGLYGVGNGANGLFNPDNNSASTFENVNFYYPGGVYGQNTNDNSNFAGAGVLGRAVVPNNQNRGVGGWFQGNSVGVAGTSLSDGYCGVLGYCYRGTAGGRFYINPYNNPADKNNHFALYARSKNTGSAFAGYFVGDVYINGNFDVVGTVSANVKAFKIDHPQDLENKYLYHSCVESPDMKNIYDGVITTNAEGLATVELPPYFEALNKDFRYQLTCIGDFAQAIVSKKIANNTFVIHTDKPNIEVSWQVTGIRKDAYAEAHRLIPEVEKTPDERGKYLNPELYGQPETQKIGYQIEQH